MQFLFVCLHHRLRQRPHLGADFFPYRIGRLGDRRVLSSHHEDRMNNANGVRVGKPPAPLLRDTHTGSHEVEALGHQSGKQPLERQVLLVQFHPQLGSHDVQQIPPIAGDFAVFDEFVGLVCRLRTHGQLSALLDIGDGAPFGHGKRCRSQCGNGQAAFGSQLTVSRNAHRCLLHGWLTGKGSILRSKKAVVFEVNPVATSKWNPNVTSTRSEPAMLLLQRGA